MSARWVELRRRDGGDEVLVYEVPSSRGEAQVYRVARGPGGWECECPDFYYHRRPCKHIARAKLRLAETVELVGDLL